MYPIWTPHQDEPRREFLGVAGPVRKVPGPFMDPSGFPTPNTMNPTPYTLHYTPYPTPYTLHPTPYTLHPKRGMASHPGYLRRAFSKSVLAAWRSPFHQASCAACSNAVDPLSPHQVISRNLILHLSQSHCRFPPGVVYRLLKHRRLAPPVATPGHK